MDIYDNKTNKVIKVKNKKDFSFAKNILVPFSSGLAGAALVVGLCVGVSPIRGLIANNLSSLTLFSRKTLVVPLPKGLELLLVKMVIF